MPFAPFLSLPAELRFKIWELYCPELGPQPQILQIEFDPDNDEVRPGEHLTRQTAPVRTVLSLCPDSRAYALHVLRNTISLYRGQGLVRYIAPRDLIRLDPAFTTGDSVRSWRPVTGFSDQVVNLAFNLARLPWLAMSAPHHLRLILSFPSLRYVFATTWGPRQRPRDVAWCRNPRAHTARLALFGELGGAAGMGMTYAWPDVPRHDAWARRVVMSGQTPLSHQAREFGTHGLRGFVRVNERALSVILEHTGETLEGMELEGTTFSEGELEHLRRVWVWPMVSLPAHYLRNMGTTIEEGRPPRGHP